MKKDVNSSITKIYKMFFDIYFLEMNYRSIFNLPVSMQDEIFFMNNTVIDLCFKRYEDQDRKNLDFNNFIPSIITEEYSSLLNRYKNINIETKKEIISIIDLIDFEKLNEAINIIIAQDQIDFLETKYFERINILEVYLQILNFGRQGFYDESTMNEKLEKLKNYLLNNTRYHNLVESLIKIAEKEREVLEEQNRKRARAMKKEQEIKLK